MISSTDGSEVVLGAYDEKTKDSPRVQCGGETTAKTH